MLKKELLFLLAFVVILIKTLLSGFSLPSIGALAIILIYLSIVDYLKLKEKIEENRSIAHEFQNLKNDFEKTKKDLNSMLDDKVAELSIKMAKVENTSKMAAFQLKK